MQYSASGAILPLAVASATNFSGRETLGNGVHRTLCLVAGHALQRVETRDKLDGPALERREDRVAFRGVELVGWVPGLGWGHHEAHEDLAAEIGAQPDG